ncbi:complex I subunit 5 family protein [Ramlibacter rhizophilus]|uniref:NADH/ubiquinone/plastoquinone (Complex I) n=1 Tax=Ramlibacter rhizophilus TaxID=1781167 RepID=A0A4Z0C1S0_9BURK|nr:complex I subunit 5 family protein [Ramlibacter rhizophilus]TFZ04195.1 NADH/ubiquinone/plastoquinone (complex I) [Ramlibacter rhizophilus]
MNLASLLVVLALAVPLVLAALSGAVREPLRLLPWAALPGLACALAAPWGTRVDAPELLLGTVLQLDGTGAVFLGLCAVLWTAAGFYAPAYLRGTPHPRSFCIAWNLTLAGSLGTCLAADAASFYLAFALVSLPAYGLVMHERSDAAWRAGRVYIALALFAEIALLLGLMLGVQAAGSLEIARVREALPAAAHGELAVLALATGLGVKCGLFPLHGWLPLAHAAAPVPASAVLSGAIVKAGILGLLRFLPGEGGMAAFAEWLQVLGVGTAWMAVALGVCQREPKPVLAYSTMSQMGLLVAILAGGASQAGIGGATAVAVLVFAVHHGLAKGALFLAVGVLSGPGRRGVLVACAVLGLALAGLPLTGGMLAKLAAKEPLGSGLVAQAAALVGAGTLLLMLRFLHLAARQAPGKAHAGPRQTLAFGALAAAALLAPWWLAARTDATLLPKVLEAGNAWTATWPLLLALALAWAALRVGRVPRVPSGDIACIADAAWLRWRSRPTRAPAPSRWDLQAWRAAGAGASRRALDAAEKLSYWRVAAVALALVALGIGLLLP